MTNTTVRARIDDRVKEEAAAVLATIGLTVSDAFRLMMMRIAKDKALPFEPLVPNAETIEAMMAARPPADDAQAGGPQAGGPPRMGNHEAKQRTAGQLLLEPPHGGHGPL